MINAKGIDAVMIYADNPDALSTWYKQHLGIVTHRNPDDGNYYADGGVADTLTGHHVQFGIYLSATTASGSPRRLMVTYRVDDFDAAVTELGKNGICIKDITDESYGRFAHFADPEGNPIEIWSPRR